MSRTQVAAQRGKAQISAPMLSFDEEDDITITLTNLGLLQRPDLFDGHTLHWHGFLNAIPLFDGVPELSLAVPVGPRLHLLLPPARRRHVHVPLPLRGRRARADGHDRDGLRPAEAEQAPVGGDPAGTKYAYNDGDGSTRYDREFAFMITELWSAAHYRDAHIQVHDWTDYDPSFWLLNGRGYPDTWRPTATRLVTTAGRLQYQPISSLVTCNAGDRVLLRLSNLGYQNHAMTVDNIDLQIVAKDASLLKGRDGTGTTSPPTRSTSARARAATPSSSHPAPGEYLLYDRNYSYLDNGGGPGYGGMMTKILVGAAGTSRPRPPRTPDADEETR